MDKVKLEIPRKEDGKWGSYISKYPSDSGKVQANMFTSGTRNVITSASGQAEKRSGGAIWNPNSLLSGAALDQYEAVFNTGQRLFVVNDAGTLKASTGNQLFTSIQAGLTNPANFEFATYQGRVYGCNGVDQPIVIDTATSYGGVSYAVTVAKTRTMGAQAPGAACTATGPSAGGSVPVGSHTYVVTYVYYNGVEESNGSAASGVVACTSGQQTVALTSIPVGGYGVTGRNIYRDNNDGNYLLLTSINNNTSTTFTDTLSVGATPTALQTTNGLPPVFKYVALFLDRLFVIDVTGKNIYWSTAGQPDVFNPKNVISGPQDDVMTAIYVFNGIPWVFGQHTTGQILGNTDGTFYYSPVSSTVGCVDNRSIQTRSIISVPTLMWLAATPNKGIYYTNGSVVQYLSDFIEDLTFNLAQISYLERQNTQASQTAFQSGTSSAGMDLTSNPGTMQTINPEAKYQTAAAWATGTMSNMFQSGDTLQLPTRFNAGLAGGSLSGGAIISSGTVTLSSGQSASNESHNSSGTVNWNSDAINAHYTSVKLAQSFVPNVTGTVNTVSLPSGFNMVALSHSGNFTITVAVYNDLGGLPGSNIGSQSFSLPGGNGADQPLSIPTATVSASVTGGTRYWIVVSLTQQSGDGQFDQMPFTGDSWSSGGNCISANSGGTWSTFGPPSNSTVRRMAASYTLTKTPVTASGSWNSAVFDAAATNLTSGMSLAFGSASYPSNTAISVLVQGSTTGTSGWVTTDTLSNPTSGTTSLTGGSYRYWQIIYNLSTTDNVNVPSISNSTLKYNTTGVWTSPAVLCTADITSLVTLTQSVTLPAGTTSTIQIRTSPDASTWSSYSAVNVATPNVYAQLRVTMTTDTANTVSPSLLSAVLDWAITSNLISTAIDTGTTPAGWGIFQYSQVGMSGTVQFYFRSAASSGALSGATFTAVGNGGFPTSSPLEFCQWKVVMTATANNLPQVNSVTVNWLLSSGTIVRAASLFFNKSYYLAVATQGSTHNDTLIEFDYEGNWRIHSGATIGTMATYFNDAFYCDSTSGNVYNAFRLPTDNGTAITFDLRTKCFGKDDTLTIIRSCRVTGVHTGTTIHAYYSLDRGNTWIEMLNSSGTLGYTTNVSGLQFNEYFVPDFSSANLTAGTNITFRLVSSDAFPCQILRLTPELRVRKGKYIKEANS